MAYMTDISNVLSGQCNKLATLNRHQLAGQAAIWIFLAVPRCDIASRFSTAIRPASSE